MLFTLIHVPIKQFVQFVKTQVSSIPLTEISMIPATKSNSIGAIVLLHLHPLSTGWVSPSWWFQGVLQPVLLGVFLVHKEPLV